MSKQKFPLLPISLSSLSLLFLYSGSHSWTAIIIGGVFAVLAFVTAFYFVLFKVEKSKRLPNLIILAIVVLFLVIGLIR
jgi:hypothetical protein